MRLYAVPFSAVSVSAAQDLFEIAPATNKPVRLHELQIANVGGTADAGDAQEELLQVRVLRGYSTSGSGGTAPTPPPLQAADSAAGFTAEVNNTTVASTGTPDALLEDGWNVRVPYLKTWTPETRPVCTAAQNRIVVRITAPADAVSVSGTLLVEEIG